YNGNNLSRYNNNGTIDNSFASSSYDCGITDIKVQTDGKIWVCGQFSLINDTPANAIVRLNNDGTIDPGFTSLMTPGGCFDTTDINKMMPQADGKLLIAGFFNNYGGTAVENFARLNANGTLDMTFAA